jgi:hypothetical protein
VERRVEELLTEFGLWERRADAVVTWSKGMRQKLAIALGAALSTALTTSALAVAVSMRVNIARSAQQLSAIVTLVVVAAVAATLKQLALTLDWSLILRIDGGLGAIGLASLAMQLRLFRRDRILERR